MELLHKWDLREIAASAVEKVAARLPKPAAVKNGAERAALGLWAKLAAMYAAVCACFRRPGISEVAAVTALGMAAVGSIVAIFKKSWRKLAPLFAVLAALGTILIVLRCIFPRRED